MSTKYQSENLAIMCGIVGYIGSKAVDSVLLVGLTRLEYRGYDSAGIAVLDGNEIQVCKEQGKIKDLEQLLLAHPVEGSLGIGHTRWATHGEPNRRNAHPHTDSGNHIAVAHNGIIENHYELRQELIKKEHLFHTDTDTEVIPHLIEEELKKKTDIAQALCNVLLRLKGRYTFVMISDEIPERVFFICDGLPLIYGQGQGEAFLASDIAAIVSLARSYHVIENGQWGWVDRSGAMCLFDKERQQIPFVLQEIQLNLQDVEKNSFPHFMLKEIHEQPKVLRRIIEQRLGSNGKVWFREKKGENELLSRMSRIMITSAGTSWHAGLLGKMYLEKFTKIATEVDLSSEFRYRNPIVAGDSKVIAISQSGETADTIASVYQAKSKFMRVLSFVNSCESTIARESDAYVDLMAGHEIGVASTKAYTAQLLNLLLYSTYVAGIRWVLDKQERMQLYEEVRKLPDQIEDILSRAHIIAEWARQFRDTKDFVFLGRSWNYPTALEGALKLKEISYIHASGYAGGEFKHGPIALITDEVPVVCIATKDEVYEKMLSNIEEVRARRGKIIAIHTEGDQIVPQLADYSFAVADCLPLLSPIINAVPMQLLAYYIAVERGCEPDQPRNLAKSVTVE